MIEVVRPESWLELHEALFEDSWQESLRRFRSDFAYRGQPDAAAGLVTSLSRLGGDYSELERHLLRNFRKYARRDAVAADSSWDWLALAKHHNLPTRVLDWSYSPYVALHFATAAWPAGADAAVWAVDFVRARDALPPPLQSLLEEERSNVFTTELLARAAGSLAELDDLAADDDFALFFEPPSLDDRIVNQFALFSLMSSPTARLDEWLEANDAAARKVVVAADLVPEARDKLDQANVTERVLFPGLDGLAAWLTRHYSPAPRAGYDATTSSSTSGRVSRGS